jgi:hypothetical protein
MAEEKSGSGLFAKVIAGVFTAVVAPVVVGVMIHYATKNHAADKAPDTHQEPVAATTTRTPETPHDPATTRTPETPREPAATARAPDQPVIHLLQGTHFSIYPKADPKIQPPKPLFAINSASQLHVFGGLGNGMLISKEDFDDFKLTAEFRWTKDGNPKDKPHYCGLLLRATGAEGGYKKDWMQSIRCPLGDNEAAGNIQLFGDPNKISVSVTAKETKNPGKVNDNKRIDYDPSMPELLLETASTWGGQIFRLAGAVDNPVGQWNTLECTCDGDTIRLSLNGQEVNVLTHVSQLRGRVVVQNDGADFYFAKLDLKPLKK